MANVKNVSFTAPRSNYEAEQIAIERQRALAEQLQQRQMPQEMFRSKFSPFAAVLQEGVAQLELKKAREQERALAERSQGDLASAMGRAAQAATGRPEIQQPPAEFGGGPGAPAQPPNVQAQIDALLSHPTSAPLGMSLYQQQIQDAARKQKLSTYFPQQEAPAGIGAGTAAATGAPWAQGAPAQAGQSGGLDPKVRALLLEDDPRLQALGKAMQDKAMEDNRIIALRPGAPGIRQGSGEVVAQPTPTVPTGMGLRADPGGQFSAYNIPGYAGAQTALHNIPKPDAPMVEIPTGKPGETVKLTQPQYLDYQRTGVLPQAGGAPRPAAGQPPASRWGGRGLGVSPGTGPQAESREYGKQLGEYSAKVQGDAANAAVSNRYLDNMQMAAQDFTPGKLAPMQSSLIQWAQAAGLPVSEDDKRAAGSIQSLASMAIKMAGQATRQADAQPSQLQYFKILESMPNESRTPEGFNKIIAYLRDANNLSIAKQQNLQQWRQTHGGSAEGFEAAWPDMAAKIPFVWNQTRRADDLKAITSSGKGRLPRGVRVERVGD